MDDFKVKSAAFALRKMFSGSSFSICTVREACEVLGLPSHGGDIDTLRLYHCVNFSEMDADTRQQLFEKTMQLFSRGAMFDLGAIDRGFGLTPTNEVEKAIGNGDSNVRKMRWLR